MPLQQRPLLQPTSFFLRSRLFSPTSEELHFLAYTVSLCVRQSGRPQRQAQPRKEIIPVIRLFGKIKEGREDRRKGKKEEKKARYPLVCEEVVPTHCRCILACSAAHSYHHPTKWCM